MLVSDGTEYSESAMDEAINIAKRCNAQLFAFSVLATADLESPLAEPVHKQEKKEVVDRLLAVRAKAEAVGVECEILLGHGDDPYTEIVDQADASAMDMIVMGRRDKADLLRAMIGSTTEKVIGHTHSNVMVVPRNTAIKGNGILLPVDGSRNSQEAAATVVNLVKQCPAPVTIISVATDESQLDDAKALASQHQAQLENLDVKVAVDVRVGRPDEAIMACAKDHSTDLIVMGSHGRTGLERLLVGSVSERVIGQAECPVLVVKL
ncbi:MAG: universal stress protein [Gammaproteobacteria bacterium]|nr:universal stress protein [Gammaproteobacteria bacterium]MDH5802777.1 universal stress protein [Gammaproteobacteria bacterium]